MKKLPWHLATRAQLYDIAFNDEECETIYKIQAVEEIERRNKKIKVNHKRKKVVYG
jgi:hypothetical protein